MFHKHTLIFQIHDFDLLVQKDFSISAQSLSMTKGHALTFTQDFVSKAKDTAQIANTCIGVYSGGYNSGNEFGSQVSFVSQVIYSDASSESSSLSFARRFLIT